MNIKRKCKDQKEFSTDPKHVCAKCVLIKEFDGYYFYFCCLFGLYSFYVFMPCVDKSMIFNDTNELVFLRQEFYYNSGIEIDTGEILRYKGLYFAAQIQE